MLNVLIFLCTIIAAVIVLLMAAAIFFISVYAVRVHILNTRGYVLNVFGFWEKNGHRDINNGILCTMSPREFHKLLNHRV